MHDRPTIDELLGAVETLFDEQLVPSLTGARQYNARVAANVVRMARRELRLEEFQMNQEWSGLHALLGPADMPASRHALRDAITERNADLCDRIRKGDADGGDWRGPVIAHVKDVVRAKLEVANPRWLLPDEG